MRAVGAGVLLSRGVVFLVVVLMVARPALASPADPRDPWEPMNRALFEVHDFLAEQVFGPGEELFAAAAPGAVQRSVNNFFINLRDMVGTAVALARFEFDDAWTLTRRVAINSTLGIGGLFDVAGEFGLSRGNAGRQPLCYDGLPTGPYLILPTYGPTTVLEASVGTAALLGGAVLLGPAGEQVRSVVELLLFFAITTPTDRELQLHRAAMAAPDPYAAQRQLFFLGRQAKCDGASEATSQMPPS
ncbi:MAG: hypothetical protein GC191_09735 [Azospirillum sp.]|nr:hypothetical protein [Azospirillum sp.]